MLDVIIFNHLTICLTLCDSYVCDEYVTGDNSCGDLSTLRSALTAISGGCTSGEASGDSQGKGCSLLRSYSQSQEKSW